MMGAEPHTEDAMSEAVAKLLPLLDALTADERAAVAQYLAAHADAGDEEDENLTEEEWEAAVAEMCERRIADLAAGRTKLVSYDEMMKRLKEKYG